MSTRPVFRFGIEIEAVVEPFKVRPEWQDQPHLYYERLAQALRNRNLPAVADDRLGQYRAQHPEHYNAWFITADSSLHGTGNQVCLEAVSRILNTSTEWKSEILLFWEAMSIVFKIQQNFTCGSHIHVSPFNRTYYLDELKIIAFAIITQEQLVYEFLPANRRTNEYCKKNSKVSPSLIEAFKRGKNKLIFEILGNKIKAISSASQIFELMQGTANGSRYVIWNFKNTVGQSGTIEFRGGRHLRGRNRTFWWLTFTIAFISLALKENRLQANSSVYIVPKNPPSGSFEVAVSRLWEKVKSEAERLNMGGNLPDSWLQMRELSSSGS